MANGKILIAIDGYSSTGKSTFAKLVAKGLGYIYGDSGALYRAIAYFAYNNGFIDGKGSFISKSGLQMVLPKVRLGFKTLADGSSATFLNGENIESSIRTSAVSAIVSQIAEVPFVRDHVNTVLKSMGLEKGLVMDGRDIGTAVFPDAELKIFMVANDYVRAQRRFDELRAKGNTTDTLESVLASLKKRDYIDSHREMDPLTRAKDAIELDNSSMTLKEEIEWINNILKPNFGLEVSCEIQ